MLYDVDADLLKNILILYNIIIYCDDKTPIYDGSVKRNDEEYLNNTSMQDVFRVFSHAQESLLLCKQVQESR